MFIFQAACPASHQPAFRPTRGSGVGAIAEWIVGRGLGIRPGGGGGGGGAAPRPPRPAASAAPGATPAGAPDGAAGGAARGGAGGAAAGAPAAGDVPRAGAGVAAGGGPFGATAGGAVVLDALLHAATPNAPASAAATTRPASHVLIPLMS